MYRLYHEIPQGLENIASIYKEVAASIDFTMKYCFYFETEMSLFHMFFLNITDTVEGSCVAAYYW